MTSSWVCFWYKKNVIILSLTVSISLLSLWHSHAYLCVLAQKVVIEIVNIRECKNKSISIQYIFLLYFILYVLFTGEKEKLNSQLKKSKQEIQEMKDQVTFYKLIPFDCFLYFIFVFFYYTSTDFSLYKSKSIIFADFLKITVKRLSPYQKVW